MKRKTATVTRREGEMREAACYEQHAGAWKEVAMHLHLNWSTADLKFVAAERERAAQASPDLNTRDEVTRGVAAAAVAIRRRLRDGDLYDASPDVRPPLPPRRG